MRAHQHAFNSALALRRVFFNHAVERAGSSSTQLSSMFLPSLSIATQVRTFRYPPKGKGAGDAKTAKQLRDEDITYRLVQVRQEDGRLSEPTPTKSVLAGLNRRIESLVVLALPKTGAGNGPRYPICKVVDKRAEQKAAAEKQKEQRKKAVQTKEMELNWGIDSHDLDHRLKQLRTFLEKGLKVEVILLNKKGKKKKPSQDEAQGVVDRVKETMGEVPGAKESKVMDGQILSTLRLFLEGPAGGVQQEAEAN